jgi:hypothetical protein
MRPLEYEMREYYSKSIRNVSSVSIDIEMDAKMAKPIVYKFWTTRLI